MLPHLFPHFFSTRNKHSRCRGFHIPNRIPRKWQEILYMLVRTDGQMIFMNKTENSIEKSNQCQVINLDTIKTYAIIKTSNFGEFGWCQDISPQDISPRCISPQRHFTPKTFHPEDISPHFLKNEYNESNGIRRKNSYCVIDV